MANRHNSHFRSDMSVKPDIWGETGFGNRQTNKQTNICNYEVVFAADRARIKNGAVQIVDMSINKSTPP